MQARPARPQKTRATHWVGPLEFTCGTPGEAASLIIDLAHAGQGMHVHLPNAYTIALADQSESYRESLAYPAINFPDGKPISWVSRLHPASPRLSQIRGPQLFLDVFDQGRSSKVRHYLLGSTADVLALLTLELQHRFPGISLVGSESPPFRPLTDAERAEQDERIRASGAQIVWVGLGTPKQDIEVQRLAGTLPIVAVAVGAAFDFAAGTLRIAPEWMIRAGLEWIFRFYQEPRRLWRRYTFGNARFLKAVLLPSRTFRVRSER